MTPFPWVKGHGTGNDFVLLPDPDASVHKDLPAELVRLLCDRRRGIGADGVIRVVRSAALPDGTALVGAAEWFMDYRNADGSVAEMCGNGVRVLARYLWELGGVAAGPLAIGTRGGVRAVEPAGTFGTDGASTVRMGVAVVSDGDPHVHATVLDSPRGAHTWPVARVHVPNPHAVAWVDDLATPGRLIDPPLLEPVDAFPAGANVEFVVRRGPGHVAMRVFERGVGETPSCGTGVVAVAEVAMRADGAAAGTPYTVDVPGGLLTVTREADGELLLTGPAVLGPRGDLDPRWLGAS